MCNIVFQMRQEHPEWVLWEMAQTDTPVGGASWEHTVDLCHVLSAC